MKIHKPFITKPFLRTLFLTVVCFKAHDRKLQMHTSQHKVLSHNAFVFCCKLFFSIVVIWCAILNIKYRVRKKVFGPMRFFIFSLCEFPNFSCVFFVFFLWNLLLEMTLQVRFFLFKPFYNLILTIFCCFEDVYYYFKCWMKWRGALPGWIRTPRVYNLGKICL